MFIKFSDVKVIGNIMKSHYSFLVGVEASIKFGDRGMSIGNRDGEP